MHDITSIRVHSPYISIPVCVHVCGCICVCTVCTFVGSCLATKVFIGNLLAMGRGWVIIK